MSETGLTSDDFTQAAEPFQLFAQWLEEAGKSEPNDPNAVALATVDAKQNNKSAPVLATARDQTWRVDTVVLPSEREAMNVLLIRKVRNFGYPIRIWAIEATRYSAVSSHAAQARSVHGRRMTTELYVHAMH